MPEIHIRLSADDAQSAVVEVTAGGMQYVMGAGGRLKEVRLPAPQADVLKQAFEKAGAEVALVPEARAPRSEDKLPEARAPRSEDKSPGNPLAALFVRDTTGRPYREALQEAGLEAVIVNTHAALTELLAGEAGAFHPLVKKDDFLKAATLLQKAIARSTVEIVAVVEGEPFSHTRPPVFATAEEVGRGRMEELEEAVAQAVAPAKGRGV